MKQLIGLLLIIAGIFLGLYVGIGVCFVGGIIQLIQACWPIFNASGIAWGLAKILCSSLFGGLSFVGLAVPGAVMLED